MGRPEYWTEKRITDLAVDYQFISDFARDYEGAYAALKTRHKHLKKKLFPQFKKLIWTKESLIKEAKKYDRRVDFRNNSLGAYSRASQIGALDEICLHMRSGRVRGAFDLGCHVDTKGIYFLIKDDEIIYIGKSESCVVSRIRWHYDSKDFDEVKIHSIKNIADMLILEVYLIARHKPIHNIEFNTQDSPSIDIAELLPKPVTVSASFGVNGVNSYKGRM